MQRNLAVLVGHHRLIFAGERTSFAFLAIALEGEIIAANDHILGRADNRLAILRLQDIVGSQHQEAGLGLRFHGKRHVHSHLVPVEVRVERCAHERMQLDRTPFNEHGLKCLNAEPVQRRCTVEHNGVIFNDHFKHVPNLSPHALHHALCALDIMCEAIFNELLHYKRFEQLERHFLGKAALVHFQFRANHDNAAAGIVHALAQKVLAEAALLAAQHIRKGFQRAVAGARNGAAAPAVVDQGVNRLLKHALFVAHDNIRRTQLEQPL